MTNRHLRKEHPFRNHARRKSPAGAVVAVFLASFVTWSITVQTGTDAGPTRPKSGPHWCGSELFALSRGLPWGRKSVRHARFGACFLLSDGRRFLSLPRPKRQAAIRHGLLPVGPYPLNHFTFAFTYS